MHIKWHKRFLEHAALVASWSKYPGFKVGCVIYDDDKNQLSGGFNGFPRGIADDSRLVDRSQAIKLTTHAEANAISTSARNGHSIRGGNLYCTMRPCPDCAGKIIQAGIKRVVTVYGRMELSSSGVDWRPEFDFGEAMLLEAGLEVLQVDMTTGEVHGPLSNGSKTWPIQP